LLRSLGETAGLVAGPWTGTKRAISQAGSREVREGYSADSLSSAQSLAYKEHQPGESVVSTSHLKAERYDFFSCCHWARLPYTLQKSALKPNTISWKTNYFK
jgi:hypothetical protein